MFVVDEEYVFVVFVWWSDEICFVEIVLNGCGR